MLYIHDKKVDISNVEINEYIKNNMNDFDPIVEDPDFVEQLHERSIYKQKAKERRENEDSNTINMSNLLNANKQPKYDYMMRDGLTPATKNIVNVRHKNDVEEDPEEISKVENVVKDIIDYGFADHVTEELLHFDEDGNLVRTEGVPMYDKEMSIDDTSLYDEYSRY